MIWMMNLSSIQYILISKRKQLRYNLDVIYNLTRLYYSFT